MHNDVIEFVFENFDDQRVLLNPRVVGELATALEDLMSAFLSMTGIPNHSGVQIDLVGAYKGSTVLSFLARMKGNALTELETTPISAIGNITAILTGLTGLLAFTAVATGCASIARPHEKMPEGPKFVEDAKSRIVENARVRHQVEVLVGYAVRAGADQVTLRVPDAPSVILSEDGSSDPRLIGSSGIETLEYGPFDGSICIGPDSIDVLFENPAGDRKKVIRNGFVVGPKGMRKPVVILWESKRPVPLPKEGEAQSESVRVKGSIGRVSALSETSGRTVISFDRTKPIPFSMRDAAGIVHVQAQIIEE